MACQLRADELAYELNGGGLFTRYATRTKCFLSLILRLLVPPSLRRARVSGLGTRFRVCDESLPHSEVRARRIYTLHGA